MRPGRPPTSPEFSCNAGREEVQAVSESPGPRTNALPDVSPRRTQPGASCPVEETPPSTKDFHRKRVNRPLRHGSPECRSRCFHPNCLPHSSSRCPHPRSRQPPSSCPRRSCSTCRHWNSRQTNWQSPPFVPHHSSEPVACQHRYPPPQLSALASLPAARSALDTLRASRHRRASTSFRPSLVSPVRRRENPRPLPADSCAACGTARADLPKHHH